MDRLSNYLSKFTRVLSSRAGVKKSVQKIIFEVLGIELEGNTILIKETVIYIKATPPIKAELFLRKKKIIERLNTTLGKKVITDIR